MGAGIHGAAALSTGLVQLLETQLPSGQLSCPCDGKLGLRSRGQGASEYVAFFDTLDASYFWYQSILAGSSVYIIYHAALEVKERWNIAHIPASSSDVYTAV